jgi:predicted dehydrogenase
MIAASRETNSALAEAFMYRHHPQTKLTGEMVREGRLGEICSVNSVFTFAIDNRDNIRLIKEYGGGSLWDVGVYPVSFAQYIMGAAPEQVAAYQWLGESGVEIICGLLRYSGDRLPNNLLFPFTFPYTGRYSGTQGRIVQSPFSGIRRKVA